MSVRNVAAYLRVVPVKGVHAPGLDITAANVVENERGPKMSAVSTRATHGNRYPIQD